MENPEVSWVSCLCVQEIQISIPNPVIDIECSVSNTISIMLLRNPLYTAYISFVLFVFCIKKKSST